MPDKTTTNGTRYHIDGKVFTWTTDDGDTVTIPLRLKLKVIRGLSKKEMDVDTMYEMFEAIAPTQGAAADEMDMHDFQAMFIAWQEEYTKLSGGATLGEASRSSA